MNEEYAGPRMFKTTLWTEVLRAAHFPAQSGSLAFADLYQAYWYPLYAYARRRGLSPCEAEDLVQEFFTHLVSKQSLAGLEREGGKFRSFLLRSLENFLSMHWRRERSQKRGGGQRPLSLNAPEGEARFALEKADAETPESTFEKRWALALLEHVTEQLRDEYARLKKEELFLHLGEYLQPDRVGLPYSTLTSRLGMSEGAIKVAVHRMRQRYGELLREAIASTVSTSEEVDEELRHLISVVGK
jgi:RNA polymerase sigma factor (sigma-70 family)